jgi:hypothetical protein
VVPILRRCYGENHPHDLAVNGKAASLIGRPDFPGRTVRGGKNASLRAIADTTMQASAPAALLAEVNEYAHYLGERVDAQRPGEGWFPPFNRHSPNRKSPISFVPRPVILSPAKNPRILPCPVIRNL